MGYKSALAKMAAGLIVPAVYRKHQNAKQSQLFLMSELLKKAQRTKYGRSCGFSQIRTYSDFKKAVPINNYEQFVPHIEQIADGRKDVLWPGLPLYFCKSSGTTSGTKYIPATREQINAMISAARNSLLMYVHETGNASFFDHKMIFLQGSPILETHGVIPAGRLSGIVYNHVPFYAHASRMPTYKTNCIDDWETKVSTIAHETLNQPMSLISGIPPWVVMYFEKLRELSGKEFIKDIFPNFKIFAYGGVNYEPYRHQIESIIGYNIDSVETYPASEGFIAYQDSQTEKGMLLNLDAGIFYEFIKAEDAHLPNAERVSLSDVALNVNYALILNTNAGLWGYSIGDTVRFVSKNPYRIVVTGRIKHFISAFGEHVIAEEVELAMLNAMRELKVGVTEFTVAPQVTPTEGLPYHEWLIEFNAPPSSLHNFASHLDLVMQQQNTYYNDLRKGNVLQQLKVTCLQPGSFIRYMKDHGKLGGQNKVPRLTNNRDIADKLLRTQN